MLEHHWRSCKLADHEIFITTLVTKVYNHNPPSHSPANISQCTGLDPSLSRLAGLLGSASGDPLALLRLLDFRAQGFCCLGRETTCRLPDVLVKKAIDNRGFARGNGSFHRGFPSQIHRGNNLPFENNGNRGCSKKFHSLAACRALGATTHCRLLSSAQGCPSARTLQTRSSRPPKSRVMRTAALKLLRYLRFSMCWILQLRGCLQPYPKFAWCSTPCFGCGERPSRPLFKVMRETRLGGLGHLETHVVSFCCPSWGRGRIRFAGPSGVFGKAGTI